MPAATLEQSSKDTSPVFVAGGRRRNHAVRLAAATLGLLLAGWLTALAAGLIGFSPLPELTLPGTGSAQSAPAPPEQGPSRRGSATRQRSRVADRFASGAGRRQGERGGAAARRTPRAAGPGGAAGQAGKRRRHRIDARRTAGAAPRSRSRPRPPAATATPASSGNPPSFTPPASGEKSASPPRGNSANAPGSDRISADPPGRAARPQFRLKPLRRRLIRIDDHGPVGRARSESARRVGRRIERPPAHWSLLALLLGGLLLLLGVQGLSTAATGRSATATTSACRPRAPGLGGDLAGRGQPARPERAPGRTPHRPHLRRRA